MSCALHMHDRSSSYTYVHCTHHVPRVIGWQRIGLPYDSLPGRAVTELSSAER